MMEEDLSDEVLVRNAQTGDRDAFDALFRRHRPLVLAVAFGRLGRAAEAEEAAQDVFLQALQSLAQLREGSRIRSWLRTITERCCTDLRVENRRRRSQLLPADLVAPQSGSGIDSLERSERRAQVMAALEALPDYLREVITLRCFGHLSYAEIAEATGLSVENVGLRLWRAREALGESLKGEMP